MSTFPPQRPLRQRSTLVLYLGTVVVVVIAMGAMQFAIAATHAAQRDAMVLVDLVREQQALATRIASLASGAAGAGQASELHRRQVTRRFARTHEHLRQANEALGVSTASAAAFQALYAGGERPLAADVDDFLARISAAEGAAPPDGTGTDRPEAVTRFAGETFPANLDSIVKAYLRANAATADSLGWTELALGALVLLALSIQGFAVAWPVWRRLGIHDEESAANDVTDPATGALTAQSFAKRAVAEIRRARRYRRPVAVLTVAPDVPAAFPDAQALRTLYGDLSATLRPSDFAGILDGGAFSVILPETDLYAAELAGHRILRELDKRQISANGRPAPVGIGIGVAQVRADEARPDEPLARAMASLRKARAEGGDRVAISPMR